MQSGNNKESESQFLGRLIRSPEPPEEEEGEEEEELPWQQSILPKTVLKPTANDYTTKQYILFKGMFLLKLCANDYITTMDLA